MAHADALLGTIDRLYAAAREPEGLMSALESVTDLLHAAHTIVIAGNPYDDGFAAGAGVDESAVENLLTIRPEDVKDGLILEDLPDGTLVRRNRLIPDNEFVNTQYYNNFVRPLGGFHSFFYRRAFAKGGMTLAVCRSPQGVDFDSGHETALAALLPHIDNAIDLHLRLRFAERQDFRLIRILESLACSVILTDELAHPLFINAPADHLLSESDGLALWHGRLAAADTVGTRRLRAAIAEAARLHPHRIHDFSPSAAGCMASRVRQCLRRPSLRPPLLITMLSIRSFGAFVPGVGEPSVALFIDEPGTPIGISQGLLVEAFGLTRRESEIATMIGEGASLASAAHRLGLGLGTARNHLKRVFDKTGVHSQASLVALVRSYCDASL